MEELRKIDIHAHAVFSELTPPHKATGMRFPLPEQLIPVFDSANTRAVHLLSRASRSGLSFGCAPQDTLSLASLSDSQAVVSLQRTLITLHGHVLEPRDLTVRLRGSCELFELMAVCAILLLCERIPDGQISIPFAF